MKDEMLQDKQGNATVAKPEDAPDSNPGGATRGGSTPPGGTMNTPKELARQAREHAARLRASAKNAGAGALEEKARTLEGASFPFDDHTNAAYARRSTVEAPRYPEPSIIGAAIEHACASHRAFVEAASAAIYRDGCRMGEITRQTLSPFDVPPPCPSCGGNPLLHANGRCCVPPLDPPPIVCEDFQILVPPGHEAKVRQLLRDGDTDGLQKYRLEKRED